ncbi:hypothetical protein ACIRTB_16000 [Streptomyces sp. NPDC101158]|uniref:hypothetical protein n=1 Tax=Streptomyces sp. NPDC101158 TaxID=3366117 RepID=UPI0037FE6DAA
MTATSEELRPLWAVRPARPPRPAADPPQGGRTEQFVLTLTGLLPLVYEQAWQSVLGPGFRLETVDWRATRPQVQDARLAERLAREAATGLPLDRGPWTHATLIRRDDRTWTFAWRYARELTDRRAGLRLLDRATEAYAVLLRGGPPPVPPRPDDLLAGPVGR